MSEDWEDRAVGFDLRLPPELRIGVYANNLGVWYSPYEFTLDGAITESPELEDPDDPLSALTIPATVVSRVRIPVGLIFDVMQTLNQAMGSYEVLFGAIRRPGEEETGDEPGNFPDQA